MEENITIDQIKEAIKNMLSERLSVKFNLETCSDDDNLILNLGLESVDILELVVALEDNWKFIINDDELQLDSFTSINKIANFVFKKACECK